MTDHYERITTAFRRYGTARMRVKSLRKLRRKAKRQMTRRHHDMAIAVSRHDRESASWRLHYATEYWQLCRKDLTIAKVDRATARAELMEASREFQAWMASRRGDGDDQS